MHTADATNAHYCADHNTQSHVNLINETNSNNIYTSDDDHHHELVTTTTTTTTMTT